MKKVLRSFNDRLKQFIGAPIYWLLMVSIIFFPIFYISSQLILRVVFQPTIIQFIVVAVSFSLVLTFALVYIFSRDIRKYISDNINAISLFSLLVTLVGITLQTSLVLLKTTFNAEDDLKQSNNITSFILNNKLTSTSSIDLIWVDFPNDSYERNLQYVSLNYPIECLSAYENVIYMTNAYNSLNQQRAALELSKSQYSTSTFQYKNLEILDQQYFEKQLEIASSTKVQLSKAVQFCQDLKQGRKQK